MIHTWGFDWLLSFVNKFWIAIKDTVVWLVDGIVYACKLFLYGVADGFFTLITGLIQAIDCSALVTAMAADYSLLPTQLVWLINAICLSQGLSVIVIGIMIRMSLNLIPAVFTRI